MDLLTPQQFEEWGRYFAVEPWGVEVDDFRMAALFSLMAAGAGAKGFDPTPLTVTSAVRAAAELVAPEEEMNVEAFLDAKFGLVN